ncbi:uncharacterized protein LOC125802521 [Astyanax mexicanus]|uniref:uncharacterized protein LOC125802521 n=1 Tax=Astyanax mexicanus TaxID=7994 RepID=UPI0020CB58EE|nr:uncharacterized protein LOC125802521 [Astyanax mexicanus]
MAHTSSRWRIRHQDGAYVIKMAPSMAAVLRAPTYFSSFSLFLCLLVTLFALNVTGIVTYDRQTLLGIRSSITHRKPDFEFHNADPLFPNIGEAPFTWVARPRTRRRRRKRGKRAGVLVRLRRRAHRPPLPTLLLANVQSLDNKLCELHARIAFQREIRDCSVICLTETWLSADIPDHAIEPAGFSLHRADRSKELSGKSKGGGVCFLINNAWCDRRNVHFIESFCSPELEYLIISCQPVWLPREITGLCLAAVYIHPRADSEFALGKLHETINKQMTARPEAALIVAGDFNRTNFKTFCPALFQHITCFTRKTQTLDHCYSNIRGAYKALPRPPFGKSDHSSILLLPTYRQRLKREPPTTKEVRRWSDQSEAMLQDCFDHVDWEMFRDSSSSIDEYADTVTAFIRKCVDDVVPLRSVRVFPNQKPWLNGDVRSALSARSAAFRSGNTEEYKRASYALRRTIKAAKRGYREKVEAQFNTANTQSLWQGLNIITDYKRSSHTLTSTNAELPEELNRFYTRFEADHAALPECTPPTAALPECAPPTADPIPPSVSEADVRRAFQRINPRKSAGPDGIPGRVLKACYRELAAVYTDIYNTSLSLSVVPACFKLATIVPVPKTAHTTCLNDWRPVALTSIISKCFERLVRDIICSSLPATLDPLQFAYRQNRSTDDAITLTLHTALSHLDKKDTYVRMLFVDYSSAFNTIVPSRLDVKLRDLGLNSTLCSWILNFLSDRQQVVRMGNITSSQ